MQLKAVFTLNQLKSEIAMKQAIQHWSGPKVYGEKCPFCGGTEYVKYSLENGKQRYRCQECHRRFTERTRFECGCQVPGKSIQCHDCPGFNEFIQIARQYSDQLRGLSLEQLQTIQAELDVHHRSGHS